MAWIILAHAALIELALIVLGPKPAENRRGIKIQLPVKVTPTNRAPQFKVSTGAPVG